MNKQEFLAKLKDALSGLPQSDIEEHLTFYGEMIEDRMEDGLSDEDAVAAVGDIDEIVAQTVSEKTTNGKKKTKRRLNTGEIVLLVLGSPIWLSLGGAAFALIVSLYVSLWAVIVSLWSIFASFVAGFVGGVIACIVFTAGANGTSGLAMLAAGTVCAGLAIFTFFGCKLLTSETLLLTKKTAIWTKNLFIGKERA